MARHRISRRQKSQSPNRSVAAMANDIARPPLVVQVDDADLTATQPRPPLKNYIAQLWQRRFFIWAESKSKSLTDGRDMFLGNVWIFLNPLIQVGIYALVFGLILKTSRGMDNFIGFLVIGVIYFGFITKGLNAGTGLIQAERSMITSFHFPKAALVASASVKHILDNIVPAIMAIIIALLFQAHKVPSWTIILVIPLFVLIHLFTAGAMLFIARATAFVPDLKGLVAVCLRGLFFVSGIFFTVDRFDTAPKLKAIVEANPIYQFLSAVRMCVLDGSVPPFHIWAYLTVWSVVLVMVGFVYFWMAEERYASVR